MKEVYIEKAKRADANSIAKLSLMLNEHHGDQTRPSEEALLYNWDNFDCWLAFKDNTVIGYIAGSSFFNVHMGWQRYEITSLYVDPLHRNQKVALKLLGKMILELNDKGIGYINIQTNLNNSEGLNFYRKIGLPERPDGFSRFVLYGDEIDSFLKNHARTSRS